MKLFGEVTPPLNMGKAVSKQLRNKIERIHDYVSRDIDQDARLLFLSKAFVIANLPHREPPHTDSWIKKNGHYILRLSPGEIAVSGKIVNLGLPYGSYARLLLIWMTTQMVQNKSRTIKVKDSLPRFLKDIGIQPTGGANGSITAIKEQLIRLCSCKITIDSEDYENEMVGSQFFLVEEKSISWIGEKENQTKNEIVMSEKFYEYTLSKSIPYDMKIISAIKQSSLTLDVYMWVTYRTFSLKTPTFISWSQLHDQMGSQYSDVNNFRTKFLKSLREVQLLYPSLKAEKERGGFVLYPCVAHIRSAA